MLDSASWPILGATRYHPDVSELDQSEAHRRFGAVYFTELVVAGVRCFGPEQRLSLADGDRAAK